jgi:cbb3-type cytochrome oxidase maturation protein
MGLAGVCVWAWGVRSGQFRDLEKTKDQIFWPELGSGGGDDRPAAQDPEATGRSTSS